MTPQIAIVVGGKRKRLKLDATIDTGFDGDLCLPVSIAVTLGLELIGTVTVELADGTQKQELVFQGNVTFLGKRRPVDIVLTRSEEALIGTELLSNCKLSVDFARGKIRITE